MAAKKSQKKPPKGPTNSQIKRHYREKRRRAKAVRAKPPGTKEKFVSGCMALLIGGGILFAIALLWIYVFAA